MAVEGGESPGGLVAKVEGQVIRDEEIKQLYSHVLHLFPRIAGLGVKEPDGNFQKEGKCM